MPQLFLRTYLLPPTHVPSRTTFKASSEVRLIKIHKPLSQHSRTPTEALAEGSTLVQNLKPKTEVFFYFTIIIIIFFLV
jgi:hypothetical protein